MAKTIENNVVSMETVNSEVMTPQLIKELEEYFLSDNFHQMDMNRIKRNLWELTYDPVDTFACSFRELNSLVVADGVDITERRALIIRDEIYRQYCAHNKYLQVWANFEAENPLTIDPIAYAVVISHVENAVEKLSAQDILIICNMLRNSKKHNVQYGALRKLHFTNIESNYLDSVFDNDTFFELADIIERKLSEKQVVADSSDSLTGNDKTEEAAPVVPVVKDTTTDLKTVDVPSEVSAKESEAQAETKEEISKDPFEIYNFVNVVNDLKCVFDLEPLMKHEKELKQFIADSEKLSNLELDPERVIEYKDRLIEFFKYSALFNK